MKSWPARAGGGSSSGAVDASVQQRVEEAASRGRSAGRSMGVRGSGQLEGCGSRRREGCGSRRREEEAALVHGEPCALAPRCMHTHTRPPSPAPRADNWGKKAIRRKTTGTGRMRHLKLVQRRFRNGFREGECAPCPAARPGAGVGSAAGAGAEPSTRGPCGAASQIAVRPQARLGLRAWCGTSRVGRSAPPEGPAAG